MTILVTGAAGFIGFFTCQALLARGERVIGIDNLNAYYDVGLKQARLDRLNALPGFAFHRLDVADRDGVSGLFARHPDIDRVVHLAAQAGVRYSLENPYAYVESNLMGQVVMLEVARRLPRLAHFVYASSSSVYGANTKLPFGIDDAVDQPVSLYAASKRSCELIAHTYSHLFGIPATGLRFFTVYGPWGRPDMAAYLFAEAIRRGEPIRVFNKGQMRRDFTYVDDIIEGVLRALDRPPSGPVPHRLYNLGKGTPEDLKHFIAVLEAALGQAADKVMAPMQPGDVPETAADITASRRDLGFDPKTPIEEGLPRFVAWYRDYHGL